MATETATTPPLLHHPDDQSPAPDKDKDKDPAEEEKPEEGFSLPVISMTLLRHVLEMLTTCEELDYTLAENRGKFQALFTRDEWDRIYQEFATTELPYEAQRLDQFKEEHTDYIFALPAQSPDENEVTRLACQFAMIESAGIASQAQLEFVIELCKFFPKTE